MDLPLLFVLYITNGINEVVCINHNGLLILPRYEPERIYGSEAITNALARQMQESMGMYGAVNLVDASHHHANEPEKNTLADLHTDEDEDCNNDEYLEALLHGIDPKMTPEEIAMKDDSPFRVCVAHNCTPHERDLRKSSMSPYAQWANELFTYQDFREWDADRKAREAQEKKIIRIPSEKWDSMIAAGEIKDKISVVATKIAQTWIAMFKPPSFPRKTPRKEKVGQKKKQK